MSGDKKPSIIPVIKKDANVQGPLKKYQVVEVCKKGVEELLRKIFDYDDIHKKINPDLFDLKNSKKLEDAICKIVNSLQAFMRETITPRFWLTIELRTAVPEDLKG